MTTYTNVAKPITPTYTNDNAQGKEQYDQASIMYDDVNVFYDGVNQSQYTSIAKPVLGYSGNWNDAVFGWDATVNTWNSTGVTFYTNIPKPL